MSLDQPIPVPDHLDAGNAPAVVLHLLEACNARGDAPAVLDFAPLVTFDSSALSTVFELSRRLGRPVTIVNPPPKLAELAELYGVSALLAGVAEEPAAG